jgi:hypothetical protein
MYEEGGTNEHFEQPHAPGRGDGRIVNCENELFLRSEVRKRNVDGDPDSLDVEVPCSNGHRQIVIMTFLNPKRIH